MSGWIKIHRSMMDHWVSDEPELLAVFVRLLSEANHTDKERMFNGCLVNIKRGQLVYGREAFSKRSGVSISKLRRYMNLLQKSGTIDQQITNKYSIITITKYDQYQVIDQQTTNNSPANSQQTATPKECKELKNVKKETSLSGKPDPKPTKGTRLTEDWMPGPEFISFCQTERPDLSPMEVGARFRDYWISKTGAQASKLNWLATWRNWVRNEKPGRHSSMPYSQTTADNLKATADWVPPEMRNGN